MVSMTLRLVHVQQQRSMLLLMVVTHSQENCKELAQISCASFLHQIFVQVHASSADDTSNKNGRSWTKEITFSILSVNHSMGTQNAYLNNLNKFKN